MPFQPLTPEQYKKARQAGFSNEQIMANEQKRKASVSTVAESEPGASEPGFVQSVAQAVAKPFGKFGASGLNVLSGIGAIARGDTKTLNALPQKEYDLGYLGKVKGIGGTGSALGDIKDSAGTALDLASNLVPVGKLAPLAKATIAGKVLGGAKVGATAGLQSGLLQGAGSELQNKNATFGNVALKTLVGGGAGLVGGGVLGGVLPAPMATKNVIKDATNPSEIMNRVALINPNDARKFASQAGETHGDYLVKRGIYGNEEQIVQKLANRFVQSKNVADTEIAKLGGTYTNPLINTTLSELAAREARVSLPGSVSKDSARVQQLITKNKAGGLSMSEINEMKRLYERNVKLGYLKENASDKIAQATNLDNNLRSWQFEQAKKLGLQNLDEINKETQLARQLGDALYKKSLGQNGNNAVGLGDLVLLAGGNPNAIAMFATRKFLGNNSVRSSIAQKLAGPATVGLPKGKLRAPINDVQRLLKAGNGKTTNAIPLGRAGDTPLTPQEIAANIAYQNSRIQNTRLALPAPKKGASGPAIPLGPKATVELPAKVIRRYSTISNKLLP